MSRIEVCPIRRPPRVALVTCVRHAAFEKRNPVRKSVTLADSLLGAWRRLPDDSGRTRLCWTGRVHEHLKLVSARLETWDVLPATWEVFLKFAAGYSLLAERVMMATDSEGERA